LTVPEGFTRPNISGDRRYPKRAVLHHMVPSTWIGSDVRVAYLGLEGKPIEPRGRLLDQSPGGLVVRIEGANTFLFGERLVFAELVE
jgi:hypothetical protein